MAEFDEEDNGGEGSSQRLTPSQSRQTSSRRQVDTPQTEQPQSRQPCSLEETDDMMREVEALVRGAEIVDNVRREVIKFHKMKRSDFNSADSYIAAYQMQYNQLGLHKVEPHPFGAMFIMLYDLEEELESVKFTYQNMKDKDMILEEITKDTFNNLCKKLIIEARDIPASSSTATASSARNTDTKNETSQRGGSRGCGRGGRGRGSSHNTQSNEKQEKQDLKPQKDQQLLDALGINL
ncbi:unnamed protein product [Penicillium discolor]